MEALSRRTIAPRVALALAAGILAVTLGMGCAGKPVQPAASPAPPPEDAAAYYPLDPGWRWAYDVERGGQTILAIYSVAARTGRDVSVKAGDETIEYRILPDGIARREGVLVGDHVLRSPIRAQASWPIDGGTARVAEVGKVVEVPAGRFPACVVIEELRSDPARTVRTTYAPGVGPVALEYLAHDPATGTFDPVMRARLRGLTRPGVDPLE